MNSSQVRRTDFYEIIPLPEGQYVILINDIVVAVYFFNSIDDAEDYVIENYYEELRRSL